MPHIDVEATVGSRSEADSEPGRIPEGDAEPAQLAEPAVTTGDIALEIEAIFTENLEGLAAAFAGPAAIARTGDTISLSLGEHRFEITVETS